MCHTKCNSCLSSSSVHSKWLKSVDLCTQAQLWVQVAGTLRTCCVTPATCGLPAAVKLRVRIIHGIITFCITATLKTGGEYTGAYYTRNFTVHRSWRKLSRSNWCRQRCMEYLVEWTCGRVGPADKRWMSDQISTAHWWRSIWQVVHAVWLWHQDSVLLYASDHKRVVWDQTTPINMLTCMSTDQKWRLCVCWYYQR